MGDPIAVLPIPGTEGTLTFTLGIMLEEMELLGVENPRGCVLTTDDRWWPVIAEFNPHGNAVFDP